MTSDEMIAAYTSATQYKSFRCNAARFKVQGRCGGEWQTFFCFADLTAARGFITLRRGKSYNWTFRVIDRNGQVVYA